MECPFDRGAEDLGNIVSLEHDPDSSKLLFKIEHEVRSMKHPLHMRPLINRDPSQSNINHAPGPDAFLWATQSD